MNPKWKNKLIEAATLLALATAAITITVLCDRGMHGTGSRISRARQP